MKTKIVPLTAAVFALISQSPAETVSFPAGTFEGGTAANWAPDTSGLASATTPTNMGNTFGRVTITGIGNGSLTTSSASPFQAQSLYVVSLDLRSSSIASIASKAFGMEVLDGNGAVVAELDQSQLVGILGLDLGVVSNLSADLTGLAGKLDLTGVLQVLIEGLDGNAGLLAAAQELVNSLVGADAGLLAEVVGLLDAVLDGTINPVTLDANGIAVELGLTTVDPIVVAIDDLLNFLTGNEGPVEALADVIDVLAGTPGDVTVVDDLLTTLLGEDGLVGNVADILLYALSDEGLLGTLNTTLTRSLLGTADPNDPNFQTVKLIFSVGSVVPDGAIGIRLSADASAALGLDVDYDNVTIERFALSAPGGDDSSATGGNKRRPFVRVRGSKLRKVDDDKVKIRGIARARGTNLKIARVEYKIRGKGAPKTKKYRKARGTRRWNFIVKPEENSRMVVRVRAVDNTNSRSQKKIVSIIR